MRYANAEAFRAALEARLRQAARRDQDLARRRRTVAFDRLLARLAVANGDAWILKGGAALELPIDRLPSMANEWSEPFATMAAELTLGAATASDAHSLVEQFWQEAVSPDRPSTDEPS